MGRNRKPKTDFEKTRKEYREACDRHVVTFETDMEEDMKRHTFAYADSLRVMGNDAAGVLNRRLEQLLRTKDYRLLQKDYGWHSERMKNLDPESDKYKKLEAEREKTASKMSDAQKQFGLTFTDIRALTEAKASAYCVGSIFALTRGEDIHAALESVLYGEGRHLHYKKRGDLPIIRAKQTNRGITFHINEEGQLSFSMDGIGAFGVHIPQDDLFLQEEYNKLLNFLLDPSVEDTKIDLYHEQKCLVPVFRPCYAALKCETIRGRLRVFIQITIAAPAVPKRKKDGSPRKDFSQTGRVGCDIGTQSYAATSNTELILDNLAERDGKSTKRSEPIMKKYRRKMSRSLRRTNPDRFTKDGRFIKGKRGPLKKSKKYLRSQYLLRERQRKDALTRKYAIRTDANHLRELGDELITEPSNAKALQKRSQKPTEKSGKMIEVKKSEGTVKTIEKNKRKKRFGHSVQFRCSGAFQAELKLKFGKGYHEVARNFRASQYDHELNEYIKKKLSDRWHMFKDGKRVQRDLYSSFLMYCSNNDYTFPDRESCLREFDKFFKKHEALVTQIVQKGLKICNSGIK